MVSAILGTRSGVFRLDGEKLTPLGLTDHHISAVNARPTPNGAVVLLAGSYGDGLFRSEDGGDHWTAAGDGLTAPAFRTIGPDPLNTGAILCGTEPARIFRSHDGGVSWQELSGIRDLAGYEEWYLPYSPRAGAVRNIYAPPGGRRLLAAVEVGGLLDSRDGGETWSYGPVLGDYDIHHVTGHPNDPDLLYASLGWAARRNEQRGPDAPPLGGVARSRDGGRTWEKFFRDYTRAIIIPPTRTDLLLAGPAKAVGEGGRIQVSADGGDTWQAAGTGIEEPMTDMVELFLAAPDGSIWALCSSGRLFRAEPGVWKWQALLPEEAMIEARSVAFLPEA
jgi:photosystem II stability/assembly factor-like uncharacterized protein